MTSGAKSSNRSSSGVIGFSRRGSLGLGLGCLREHLEEELFVETRELTVGGDGEQLVAEIHEHAVVSGGVVGERDAELAGHERRIAGGR